MNDKKEKIKLMRAIALRIDILDITQKEAARRANVSQPVISNIKTLNSRNLSIEYLVGIARALGLKVKLKTEITF